MTSYRLLLVRSALGRCGRALAYYWLTLRSALRTLWASYGFTMVRYRVRAAASGTGRALVRLPRKVGSLLGLIAWFLGQLRPYLARVLAERREDRAELRAERRLLAAGRRAQRAERRELRRGRVAERRARRRAEHAEIKADRDKRPHHLPVPPWLSRPERPERPRRVRAPRLAMVTTAVALAAAVPTYAIVSGVVGSDEPVRAFPEVLASTAPVVPGTGASATPSVAPVAPAPGAGPAAPGPVVSGDPREFVRTLPPLPTASPTVPAPRLQPSPSGTTATGMAGTTSVSEPGVVGSLDKPLSAHQQREARRQAKWEARQHRLAQQVAKNAGK